MLEPHFLLLQLVCCLSVLCHSDNSPYRIFFIGSSSMNIYFLATQQIFELELSSKILLKRNNMKSPLKPVIHI